jgi:hypothetical protein
MLLFGFALLLLVFFLPVVQLLMLDSVLGLSLLVSANNAVCQLSYDFNVVQGGGWCVLGCCQGWHDMVLVLLERELFEVIVVRIDGVLGFGDHSLGDPNASLSKEDHVGVDV